MPEENLAAAELADLLLDPSFSPQAFTPQDDESNAEPDARINSRWHGTDEALKKLGLRQGMAIRARELTAVLSDRHVRTGVRVLPAGEFFDLVFLAPNSLSFLWSQLTPGPRADIEDAMLDSSAIMLDHLTADYPLIGGIRPARSFVASLVLHAVGTLSAANGAIPPLLHVHCWLFAVMDETGTLMLPDEATLYDEETLHRCDGIGEAKLAARMVELGYAVNQASGRGHSFEIAGIPQELLDNTEFWQNTGCAIPN
jgi:TrwC relaxase